MKKILLSAVTILVATGCQTNNQTVGMHERLQLQEMKNLSVSAAQGEHKHLSSDDVTKLLNKKLQKITADGQPHFNLVSADESDVQLTSEYQVSVRTKNRRKDNSTCLATKTDKDSPNYATNRKHCTSWAKSTSFCQTTKMTVKFMPQLVTTEGNIVVFDKTYSASRVTSNCGGSRQGKADFQYLVGPALAEVLSDFTADIAPYNQLTASY